MPAMNLTTDPSSINANVSDSPLLSLPPEMRNRIYEYVMTVGTVYVQLGRETRKIRGFVINEDDATLSHVEKRLKVTQSPYAKERDSADQPAGGQSLSLLRSCKQVYQEAAQLFLACNSFEIQAFDQQSELVDDLLHPGLFQGAAAVESIAAALPKFVDTIGDANAKVLTDVTLHLGQVDEVDVDNEFLGVGIGRTFDTVKPLLDHLRHFRISTPSWHLSLGAAFRLDSRYAEDGVDFHEWVIDPDAAFAGLTAAIATISDRAQKALEMRFHLPDQIERYAHFLREMQKVVEVKGR
ncbi:hypothetical protein LTS10_012196 [Elasticomyces elasticus]|nr:hypothetical protein LTS10_012196 [Elasticomyces elasticus]